MRFRLLLNVFCLFILSQALFNDANPVNYLPQLPPITQSNQYLLNPAGYQNYFQNREHFPNLVSGSVRSNRIVEPNQNAIVSTFSTTQTVFDILEEDVCQPRKNWSQQVICEYVKLNSDNCEGGGYMLWVRYVECTENTVAKVFIIVSAVIYMLFMFVMITTVADEFFSPNVSAIVGHLGMTESVAGVTLLALGNGANDIFQSVVSVLTVPTPKAGLALGSILGGGMFVTCMVTSTIVLTDPFKAHPFSTVRDIVFYMGAIGFILLFFLYDTQVHIWQPALMLGYYLIYVSTVVIYQQLQKRRRKARNQAAKKQELAKEKSVATGLFEKLKYAFLTTHDLLPLFKNNITEPVKPEREQTIDINEGLEQIESSIESDNVEEPEPHCGQKTIIHNHTKDTLIFTLSGVIHRKEHEPEDVEQSSPNDVTDLLDRYDSYPLWKFCYFDIRNHLNPFNKDEWIEAKWYGKTFWVLKVPCLIYYKATIPHCDNEWSKSVALLHCIISPIIFVFNVSIVSTEPFNGSPGLWAYALVVSIIALVFIAFFTKFNSEPWIFKRVSYYLGFLMAISFVYFLASEVIGVVTMIGMVTGLSQELLGITILAWSNSLGDLISDTAVVRAGMHRMALAAAIGGPLFSLLIGFGLPFLIAKAKGKVVTIAFTPIFHILLLFFAINLSTLLFLMLIQRFRLRRVMAIPMISIYVVFMLMAILTEFNVVLWGTVPPEYV